MILYIGSKKYALIAQLDRASGYGPEGREFESSSARQERHLMSFFFCIEDSNSERVSAKKSIDFVVLFQLNSPQANFI